MNKVNFLGEQDFISVMKDENRKWRKACVKQGKVRSFDGTAINYYKAVPENPRAAIVICHGFCEFFGKYHEYAWYLYQAGFAVYFPEQRGHGYSEGKQAEHDVVYIDNYDTYVEDIRFLMDNAVVPETDGMKRIILAHSMGGAVAALFLEKYPGYFDGAIFSSPMFKMKNNTPPIAIAALRLYVWLFRKGGQIAPGQKHFDAVPVYESSSTLSKPRYDYMFEMRLKDEHYQTYGASIGWGLASLSAGDKLIKNASKITIPVTVFTAGEDHLIDKEGYSSFAAKVPSARFINYENSRHEIFNADEVTRKQYYTEVLETLDKYLSQGDGFH